MPFSPVIPIPPYVPEWGPAPQVTPFTYRDGRTYIQRLENLKRYIDRIIVPWVNENVEGLSDELTREINALIDQVNQAVQEIINNSITVQDSVVAGIFNDLESQTRVVTDGIYASVASLNDVKTDVENLPNLYTLYRLWDGSSYPARIDGALNIFFGPVDPGLSMGDNDYWADPDITTMSNVIAEALDTSSDLYDAIKTVASSVQTIPLNLNIASSDAVQLVKIGTGPDWISGYKFPDAVMSMVCANARIPFGWENVTVNFRWTTANPEIANSNVRFFVDTIRTVTNDIQSVGNRYIATVPIPLNQKNNVFVEGHSTTVSGGDGFSTFIIRDGGGTNDVYTGDVILIDAWLARA